MRALTTIITPEPIVIAVPKVSSRPPSTPDAAMRVPTMAKTPPRPVLSLPRDFLAELTLVAADLMPEAAVVAL